MKDQVTTLMEALRLSQNEIEKLNRKRQDVFLTVAHIEGILDDPVVKAAIQNLEPLASPSLVPEPVKGKCPEMTMTTTPSIVPERGQAPSAHEIPQALHDSEINFKIECFYDRIWTATLGDEMNGWGDHSRRPNYVDALLHLKDLAIERFPNSKFARNYAGITFAEEPVIDEEDNELLEAREEFTRLSLFERP